MSEFTTCAYSSCSKEFTPGKPTQRFCCAAHRAAAHREKALQGPSGVISSGPRKNKSGASVTIQFTGPDAERVLRMNPKDAVHLVRPDDLPEGC